MNKLLVIVLVAGLVACKKYVPGPQGDAGTNGHNGNVNIAATASFEVKSTQWDSIVINDTWSWERKIAASVITNNAITSGDIMVYKQINGEWYPLPVFEGFLCTQALVSLNQITIKVTHLHGAIPPRPNNQTYRITVLEPKQ